MLAQFNLSQYLKIKKKKKRKNLSRIVGYGGLFLLFMN